MNGLPFVSIVIPAYNEEKNIENCINSLRVQDYPKDKYEIIVTDNGSNDNTAGILQRLNIKYFVAKNRGRPYALNIGIKHSRGEIIAFTDADCVAEPKWLRNIAAGFSDPSIGCVAGEVKILGPQGIPIVELQKRKRYFSPELTMHKDPDSPLLPTGSGGNLSFRKEVFEKAGYFDENFIRGQEAELCWRMQIQTEYKINYALGAIVWHKCETTLPGLLKQRFKVGWGQSELRKKYSEKFMNLSAIKNYWVFLDLLKAASRILKYCVKGVNDKEYKQKAYDEFIGLATVLTEMSGRAYWKFFGKNKRGNNIELKIPILMYHHVGEPVEEKDRPYFVSAKRFKKQIWYLQKAGYQSVDLSDLLEGLRNDGALPEKPIVITFDDGTESIYKNAFPILQDRNFKAIVFLAVNYINKSEMQDESFLKYIPLTWGKIKEMQDHGISFYPHSLTHPHLTKIASEKAYFEIHESKRILEEKLGKPMDFFSYPYGDINEEIRKMVERAGYRGALDAWGGMNNKNTDIFRLKRIPVFERDDSLQLKLKLLFGLDKVTFGFLAKYYWGRLVAKWT